MLVESSIVRSTPVDSDDIVSMINDEYDEYQEELMVRDKKLKIVVDFTDDMDSVLSVLSDKQVIF